MTPKALIRTLHQMGDCEENTMFSILMNIYIVGQFYWYNLFSRLKKDRFPLFEHNLHIIALKRTKMVMNYKMVKIHWLLKHLIMVLKLFLLLYLPLSAEFMLDLFIILMA